jgi:hypothetical protein
MKHPSLPTKEEIDAEVVRVKKQFCNDYKKQFMANNESFYGIARDSGKDTGAVKDLLTKPGDLNDTFLCIKNLSDVNEGTYVVKVGGLEE